MIAKRSTKQAVDLAVGHLQMFLVEIAERGDSEETRLQARNDALRRLRREVRRWGMPLGDLYVFGTERGLLVVRRNWNRTGYLPIPELEEKGDVIPYPTILNHVLEISKMKHLEEFIGG